ncbi:MAG: CsgG/HfaB family protein [Rhodothermales bacterium]
MIKNHTLQPGMISLAARFGVCLMLMLASVSTVRAQDESLKQAVSVYNTGDYSQAADLFSALAKDEAVDVEVRKEALRYLGRAYIARSLIDEARKAVTDLLDLQPPLIELDPDIEPPTLMNLYYEARGELEVPKGDPGMHTLAVMDFRNYALDKHDQWDPMQWGFSSMMIEQLSGATDLKLVDRENLQWILGELDLQQDPSRVDQATAVRVGKVMGAHAMVFGGIYVTGRDMRLSARVVKVETSEILLGESVEGRVKNFYELMEKLSLKVAQSINSSLTQTDIGNRTETKSLDAMRSYSEGLKLLEGEKYLAAHEKFLEALEYDPSYRRAKLKADSLRPVLAAMGTSGSSNTGSSGGTLE